MKCWICNKTNLDLYSYTDIERGIKNIEICYLCLLEHVEKYFGECSVSKFIRKNYNISK